MATALEPAHTIQYSSPDGQNTCEEPVTFGLSEKPITPLPTPSSCTAPSELGLRLAPRRAMTEALSRPAHSHSSRQEDIDRKEPVAVITSAAEVIFDTKSAALDHDHNPGEDQRKSETPSSQLHPSISDRTEIVQGTDIGVPLQGEEGASQHLANSIKARSVDPSSAAPSSAAPKEAATTRSDAKSAAAVAAKYQGSKGISSEQISSKVIWTKAISSPDIYQWDKKLYVGKMKEMQCPPHVQAEWMAKIRPRLIKDLLPVLQSLPRSMASEETIIEPDICMAGYVERKATEVQLKPTIWIRCGGKKCKKVIRQAVDDLSYLHSFSQSKVEVRIRSPRPAASSPDSVPEYADILRERTRLEDGKIRLQVEIYESSTSACGLRIRALDDDASVVHNARISTIGGLIKVDKKIYGLTTAHGILAPLGAPNPSPYFSESDASDQDSDSESDSGDESGTSFDTGDLREHDVRKESQSQAFYELGQIARTKFEEEIQQLKWQDARYGPISYCGQGSSSCSNCGETPPPDTDFALIELDYLRYNDYISEDTQSPSWISVNRIKRDPEDLDAGEVLLLAGNNQIIKGNLLPGSALFINRAIVFNTRKIQLDEPLPPGTSGTWVVQDNLLCGIIVAVYDDDPYAHMITADKMFQDIRNFLTKSIQPGEVDIATEEDINAASAITLDSHATSFERRPWGSDSITITKTRVTTTSDNKDLEDFFKTLYTNADDGTKKAMLKSLQESGGAFSTTFLDDFSSETFTA